MSCIQNLFSSTFRNSWHSPHRPPIWCSSWLEFELAPRNETGSSIWFILYLFKTTVVAPWSGQGSTGPGETLLTWLIFFLHHSGSLCGRVGMATQQRGFLISSSCENAVKRNQSSSKMWFTPLFGFLAFSLTCFTSHEEYLVAWEKEWCPRCIKL